MYCAELVEVSEVPARTSKPASSVVVVFGSASEDVIDIVWWREL